MTKQNPILIKILAFWVCLLMLTQAAISASDHKPEISFDIWDWTAPAQDLDLFRTWVEDLADLGFTRLELSVPWRLLEPEPRHYDLRWLEERIRICEHAGLGMRLRINSYYGGATPDWYTGDRWLDAQGNSVPQGPPSIMDERFWNHYGPLCETIAALGKGRDILYNAFIGIHAELKYADWWSYDEATLTAWRAAIQAPRPAWLREVVGELPLPERPEIPPATQGVPDTIPTSLAFIAFREQCWREAVLCFEKAIRKGDPDARISAPLGESFRRQSASMANLDYWGLTRGASQVVHSYDFFRHAKDPAWMAAASVHAFQGITGLPVVFEFDGTPTLEGLGYSIPHLLALGQAAASAGAGLKFANNSYSKTLPSQQPLLRELIDIWRHDWKPQQPSPGQDTILLFCSKWANYTYRESTEWLHEAQFGMYKLFRDAQVPVRIINEDNLGEDLSGYRALYAAFSPRTLMPASTQQQLSTLPLLLIEDFMDIPEPEATGEGITAGLAQIRASTSTCPLGPQDVSNLGPEYQYALTLENKKLLAYRPKHVVMGYPVGSLYLHDELPTVHQGLVLWALGHDSRGAH
ncbi:MAG: hypothetical protein BWY09_00465 [Candidatus Hydrogenedentes bacterium ADurb.Bin179]|nr:MAG: hypothetical protein BWY09_00465 [Candidatus Hydrogenedentes bacterium ADurb.Bin179]